MRRILLAELSALLACGCGGAASDPDAGARDAARLDAGPSIDAGPRADAAIPPVAPPDQPAVARGADYMGSPERFNRYYTDRDWAPSLVIFVSPSGGGSGDTRDSPTTVADGLSRVAPGQQITFVRGTYAGCYELGEDEGGTYDDPIVLYAERNTDGSRGVRIDCCASGRQTCINLEAAHYVAVDGFEVVGGRYGVRAVGTYFDAPSHQRGVAVLNVDGHGQSNDPFLTGHSDWAVFERNVAHDVGTLDGHGIYLSNGGDWNIARFNETFDTSSSDFQINADPAFACPGIATDDPRCDGSALDGLGQGVSEFMTIEGNYFHHSGAQGPNFTSVRNSLVRNNVFAFATLHGTSFWQETTNPNLASHSNVVVHNLFVGNNDRELVQFIVMSNRNDVRNNVFVGTIPNTIVLNVDGTTDSNTYADNIYVGGHLEGRSPDADERTAAFAPTYFVAWPETATGSADIADFVPSAGAPFLNVGALLAIAPLDRAGVLRVAPVDLGPFEAP
jgi:hypothetical protein